MSSPNPRTSPPPQTDPPDLDPDPAPEGEGEGEAEIDELDSTSEEDRPLAKARPVGRGRGRGRGGGGGSRRGRGALKIPGRAGGARDDVSRGQAPSSSGMYASDADEAEDSPAEGEGEGGVGEGSRWSCEWEECREDFATQESLVGHLQKDHILLIKDGHHCQWRTCKRRGEKQATRHSLVTHCRAHTGERPYTCPQPGCRKTFTRSDAMNKHIRSLHPGTTRRAVKDAAAALDGDVEGEDAVEDVDMDEPSGSPSKSRVKREEPDLDAKPADAPGRLREKSGGRKGKGRQSAAAAAAAAALAADDEGSVVDNNGAEGSVARGPSRKGRRKGPTAEAGTNGNASDAHAYQHAQSSRTSRGDATNYPTHLPSRPLQDRQASLDTHQAHALAYARHPSHAPGYTYEHVPAPSSYAYAQSHSQAQTHSQSNPYMNPSPFAFGGGSRRYGTYGSTSDLLRDDDIARVIERILNRPAVPMSEHERRAVERLRERNPRGTASGSERARARARRSAGGRAFMGADAERRNQANGSGNGHGHGRGRDDDGGASTDDSDGEGYGEADDDGAVSEDSFDEGISWLPDDGQTILGSIATDLGADFGAGSGAGAGAGRAGGEGPSGEAAVYLRSKWANRYIIAKAKLMLVEEEMAMRRKEWDEMVLAEREVVERVESEMGERRAREARRAAREARAEREREERERRERETRRPSAQGEGGEPAVEGGADAMDVDMDNGGEGTDRALAEDRPATPSRSRSRRPSRSGSRDAGAAKREGGGVAEGVDGAVSGAGDGLVGEDVSGAGAEGGETDKAAGKPASISDTALATPSAPAPSPAPPPASGSEPGPEAKSAPAAAEVATSAEGAVVDTTSDDPTAAAAAAGDDGGDKGDIEMGLEA